MVGPERRVRRSVTALVAAGLVGLSTGCTSFSESGAAGSSAPSSSAASSTTRTSSSAPSTSRSSTTTPPSTSSGSTQTTSGGPLGTEDAGRRLTLADFFQPTPEWEERRYDIAGQQDVQGIGVDILGCNNPHELELRLQNNFDQLEFSVGQADDSQASDQEIVVEVLANNAQVDIRSVPFNQLQPFSVPVGGVNALKLRFQQNDELVNCRESVTAVLTEATLR